MVTTTTPLTGLLKVLADPTRLRILALLEREELSVGELARALGLAQSRVSNHLRVLREASLLAERHSGASTFLRHAAAGRAAGGDRPGTAGSFPALLWSTLREELPSLAEHRADRVRLEGVLAERRASSDAFFDSVAGRWDTIGVDFATGQARQRAAACLLPEGLVLADLGCGTGYMAAALAGLCERLICVDRSPGMLEEARRRLATAAGSAEVELRQGDLDALPIDDGELDGLIAGMVLHHLPSLDAPLAEMRRVLRPGGSAVVLELMPHREEWMHEALGDRHLGLEPKDVATAFERAGFAGVAIEPLDDHYRPRTSHEGGAALPLYVVRARAPRTHRP